MKSPELYIQFDNIFFEKTRLSIMTILYKEDLVSFNRLKKIIGSTDGAIYTHLQKLNEANYITRKKEIIGSKLQTFYSMTKEGRSLFSRYLSFMEKIIMQSGNKER